MTVANLLMPVAGLIKVFIIFYFVFFSNVKLSSSFRLGTEERRQTLTHRSSSSTIARPPLYSSSAASLSRQMTSSVSRLESNQEGVRKWWSHVWNVDELRRVLLCFVCIIRKELLLERIKKCTLQKNKAPQENVDWWIWLSNFDTFLFIGCCSIWYWIILFLGSTISCFGPDGVPGGLLNTYCWIMSTFRLVFQFFSSSCYFWLVPQIDEESTRYRKILCLADSDIVH